MRPEHLDVGTDGWEVTVDTVELLGAERLIYARLDGEPLIVRVEEGRLAPSPATPCTWRPAKPPALVQRRHRQAHLKA